MSELKTKLNPEEYEGMVDRDRDDPYMKKIRAELSEK